MISKNLIERALWTGAQALIALAITYLTPLAAWWAAPIALLLSALKTYIIDKRVDDRPTAPVTEVKL